MSFKLLCSLESLVRSLVPVLIACLAVMPASTSFAATGGTLSVVTTSPLRAVLDASTNGSISVTFDRPVDPDSINVRSFHAFSRGAGSLRGEFLFSADGHTVTLDPIRNASPGEPVTVTLIEAPFGRRGTSFDSGPRRPQPRWTSLFSKRSPPAHSPEKSWFPMAAAPPISMKTAGSTSLS